MSSYKQKTTFEQRETESHRIRGRYPGRIPVIVENDTRSDIPVLNNNKYLVPGELTMGQFIYVIRKRIKISPEKALFIMVNDKLPPTAALVSTLYHEHADSDGFLYFSVSGESTFGTDSFTLRI